jgi:hypothetical protein
MVDRRGFIASLLAAPLVGRAVRGEDAALPLMQSGAYPYDAFCFTLVPATSDWKEHGRIDLLRSGDPYPEGFEGWVAFRHPADPERFGIRWGGEERTCYDISSLGEPVYNYNEAVPYQGRSYPALERASERWEQSLTFDLRKACRVLVDFGNQRRPGMAYRAGYGHYGT